MKKLLFVGASGYGNLGDDGYKTLFARFLSDKFDLTFDSPYPDIAYLKDMDGLVIGGGGLIYENHTAHLEYMKMYMDEAIRLGKPLFFSSCGVQLIGYTKEKYPTEETTIAVGSQQIKNWKPYLDIAKCITVRSKSDMKIIQAVTNNPNVFYFPDLAYATEPSPWHIIQQDSYVFIPTPSGHKLHSFQNELAKAHEDKTRRIYFVAFSFDDYQIVEILGNQLEVKGNYTYKLFLKPEEACGVLRDAYKVITNRYHGAILARAAGKPESAIVVADTRYKSVVEQDTAERKYEALGHILKLKEFML